MLRLRLRGLDRAALMSRNLWYARHRLHCGLLHGIPRPHRLELNFSNLLADIHFSSYWFS
jgi:hypothetical protein